MKIDAKTLRLLLGFAKRVVDAKAVLRRALAMAGRAGAVMRLTVRPPEGAQEDEGKAEVPSSPPPPETRPPLDDPDEAFLANFSGQPRQRPYITDPESEGEAPEVGTCLEEAAEDFEVTGPDDSRYNCLGFVLDVKALVAVPRTTEGGDGTDALLALAGWRRIEGFAPGCVVAYGLSSEGLDGSATTHVARHVEGPWFEGKLGLGPRVRHHLDLPPGYRREYGDPYRYYGVGSAPASVLSTGVRIVAGAMRRYRGERSMANAAAACEIDEERWRGFEEREESTAWPTVGELLLISAALSVGPIEFLLV